jgi:hypothetical protein
MATNLIIPDSILADTLKNGLDAFRKDFKNAVLAGNEQKSLLYIMYNGLALGKYIMYDNLKKLICNTPEDPNYIEVKLSYDHDSKRPISIHISLPSESDRTNSLQIGEGDYPEFVTDTNNDGFGDTWRAQFGRRFSATYHIVIMADNKNEVIAIYSIIKMILISCINHLELSGLLNIKLGGGDVRLNESAPERRFIRPITISFEYETVAPELLVNTIINQLNYSLYFVDDSSF